MTASRIITAKRVWASIVLPLAAMSLLVSGQEKSMNSTNGTMIMNETIMMLNESTTTVPSEEMTMEMVPDDAMMEDEETSAPTTMHSTTPPVPVTPQPVSMIQVSISLPPPTSPAPTALPTDDPTKTPTNTPTQQPTLPLVRSCFDSPVTNAEIQTIRTAIENLIEDEQGNINYKAKFVRLGFHDCVGGCDGCVDMSDPENTGLEVPIEGLAPIVEEYENGCISRADIWALAALVGAQEAQNDGLEFPMVWVGRRNCNADDPMNGPAISMPSPDMDVHGLLDFFWNEFGFNPQQVVALMGAHSIGRVDEDNSGFVGRGWDDDNEQLDNDYYRQLDTDVRWNQVNAGRHQWEGGDGGSGDADEDGIIMLNVDIALVRDFSAFLSDDGDVNCRFRDRGGGGNNDPVCPHAVETIGIVEDYQNDNGRFLNDFRDVLSQLLAHGYDTGDGCDTNDPCRLPGSLEFAVSKSESSGTNSGLRWGDYFWG